MIGLGSNRLTCCRRGGMSVTQAGRGGMEWLAGGRRPSWASPYSAQATAALKDAFTAAQWATIRDYGFAHPEIVGYMNAYAPEDAKIAYSLVEGIGWRAIYGDGSAAIHTGVKGRVKLIAEMKFINNNSRMLMGYDGNGSNYFGKNGTKFEIGGAITDVSAIEMHRIIADFTTTNAEMTIDGVTTRSGYDVRNVTNLEFKLFDGVASGFNCKMWLGIGEIYNEGGTMVRNYIPFKRNGQMGFLDLLTGQLADQVGTFTELIESPAS